MTKRLYKIRIYLNKVQYRPNKIPLKKRKHMVQLTIHCFECTILYSKVAANVSPCRRDSSRDLTRLRSLSGQYRRECYWFRFRRMTSTHHETLEETDIQRPLTTMTSLEQIQNTNELRAYSNIFIYSPIQPFYDLMLRITCVNDKLMKHVLCVLLDF